MAVLFLESLRNLAVYLPWRASWWERAQCGAGRWGAEIPARGAPVLRHPHTPGEAQDSFSVDWWAAVRLEPNCFLLKTIFCFVGMMVSSV